MSTDRSASRPQAPRRAPRQGAPVSREEERARLEALLQRGETPEALEALGVTLLSLGRPDEGLARLEQAYRLHRQEGAPARAARIATWLALEYGGGRGEAAVANGWLRRARRLLDPLPPGPDHAWLTIWEGHVAYLYDDDLVTARRRLAEGLALARSLCAGEAEMLGLALEGLTAVAEGRVEEGLSQLDEATTTALSGEFSDLAAVGQTCCYALRACEQVQDFDRAAQWCERVNAYSRRLGIPRFLSFCRLHYSAVLLWRGAWREAEEVLETVLREVTETVPTAEAEARARIGELRRRQGRFAEAAALLAGTEAAPGAMLVRAALALDRGEPAAARELADRYLRRLSPEDRIQRAPGLTLQARADAALGRHEPAAAALAELREFVEAAGTEALWGALRQAEGAVAVAAGDTEAARRACEDAVDRFERAGVPFEAGRARLDLAEVLLALGRPAAALDEARAAHAQLERIGAVHAAGRAAALLAAPHPAAPAAAGPAAAAGQPADGLTPRQREVLRHVAQGLSNRDIGERLHLSEFTVKRHVADILTKLDLPSRAAAAAYAVQRGVV